MSFNRDLDRSLGLNEDLDFGFPSSFGHRGDERVPSESDEAIAQRLQRMELRRLEFEKNILESSSAGPVAAERSGESRSSDSLSSLRHRSITKPRSESPSRLYSWQRQQPNPAATSKQQQQQRAPSRDVAGPRTSGLTRDFSSRISDLSELLGPLASSPVPGPVRSDTR